MPYNIFKMFWLHFLKNRLSKLIYFFFFWKLRVSDIETIRYITSYAGVWCCTELLYVSMEELESKAYSKVISIFSQYGFEINFSVVIKNKTTTKKLRYKNMGFDFKILEFLVESMMHPAANFRKENISDIKTFKR